MGFHLKELLEVAMVQVRFRWYFFKTTRSLALARTP